MSRFLVGDATQRDTLQRVTELAMEALPDAAMAGITTMVDGRPATWVFTHDVVAEIDAAQYRTGVGPCLDALRNGETYRIDSVDKDRHWPHFSEAAGAQGVRSTISVPLVAGSESVGALNFYSRSAEAFSDDAVALAMQFASQAAVVLSVKPEATADAGQAAELARGIDGVISQLLRHSTQLAPDDLARLVADECRAGGFFDVTIFLVDLEQVLLVPLSKPTSRDPVPLDVDTTIAGRAFQLERPFVVSGGDDGSVGIWVPLIDGAERLGVMYLHGPAASDELLRRVQDLAGLVSELVVSKTQYGDALVVARRTQQMTLAAELRWAMLPPTTFSAERVALACVMEPAYEVAGDAFDYAFDDDVLHLAVMDAMGHGLEACRLANLATAGYRTARRRGLDLPATYRLMDDALRDQFGDEHFVTAQLATLDTRTGMLRWLNAGHPRPLLLRGGRTASELRCEPALPLGLGGAGSPVAELALEPNDALLFFTDGIVEAHSPGGERFGAERLLDLTRRALADRQTLSETVRRLVRAVRAHRDGPLADDATILCVDWHPKK
jgi:serine phosphatase RsbU (regulator of sigma subunit)/putative methionine-R-sulfoxide reductase with GAF domain